MKIFVDTANLAEIQEALQFGVDGVTTNPALFAKEPQGKFEERVGEIVDLLKVYTQQPSLSVEVFSRDPDEIVRQAMHFVDTFQYEGLAIKVQIGKSELKAIRRLASQGIKVNCTCCMTPYQALQAARAGAKFVSLFWGRIRDFGEKPEFAADRAKLLAEGKIQESDRDPHLVVGRVRLHLDRYNPHGTEIIAGSMRTLMDVWDSGTAGAHIVTAPFKFFEQMQEQLEHPATGKVVEEFFTKFKQWQS